MGRCSVGLKRANRIDVADAQRGLLSPENVRQVTISGLVDTGATRLVIPTSVAEQLGARKVGEIQVRYADRRRATRQLVDDVLVELQGRLATFRAVVEPNRDSVIIGAMCLKNLTFLLTVSLGNCIRVTQTT